MQVLLDDAVADAIEVHTRLSALGPQLTLLAQTMFACRDGRGKVLIAGNDGSLGRLDALIHDRRLKF